MKKKAASHLKKKTHRKKKIRFLFHYRLVLFPLVCILFGVFAGFVNLYTKPHFCANAISCIKNLSGEYKASSTEGEYLGQKLSVPHYIADNTFGQAVLGDTTSSNKHIYIDLTNQRLMAFEGNKLVYSFLVSTGWWNFTPTGDYKIWIKLRYTNMVGGDKAKGDYYNLPNVPFTMYFYNDQHPKWEGYGIHDAYWHNDFGHPRSHGCINMALADSETLYNWATPVVTGFATYASDNNPGTPITIYGVTPNHYW